MDWHEAKAYMRNQEEQMRLYRAALHVERAYRLRLEARLEALERKVHGAGVVQIAPERERVA